MEPENLAVFVVFALIAEILGTVGGFGSSIFFIPVASLFLDFHSVLGITALFHLASNLSKILLFRKGVDKKLIFSFGIPAVLFVAMGAYLSKFISSNFLQVALSFLLIALSTFMLLYQNFRLPSNRTNSVVGGAFSGFIAGLLGTGGAIRGLVLAAFDLEKDLFIATSAIIDMGIDLSRGLVYFSNGYIHRHDLYLLPILLVVSFVGTYLGKLIIDRFNHIAFKKVVLFFILFTGIATVIKLLGIL